MSGSIVKTDLRKLENVLKKYGDFAFKRVLQGIGQMVVTQTKERFDSHSSPDGKPWKSTARGGNILRDTSSLYNSLHYRVSGKKVAIGTNIIYGAIHQFGGTITPKKSDYLVFFVPGVGFRKTKKVNIPARPYLGVNEENKMEIKQFIQNIFAEYSR